MSESTIHPPEVWKPIPGWEGFYSASDQGRIRSDARTFIRKDGKPFTVREKVMATCRQKTGYFTVHLRRIGTPKTYTVHSLVLLTFVGPCPVDMECCHGPGGQTDNRLSNLRYDTRSENFLDKLRHHPERRTTHCPRGHSYSENAYYAPGSPEARHCYACMLERSHSRPKRPRPRPTHCKSGHELTPDNVWLWGPNKWRKCKTCERVRRAS